MVKKSVKSGSMKKLRDYADQASIAPAHALPLLSAMCTVGKDEERVARG